MLLVDGDPKRKSCPHRAGKWEIIACLLGTLISPLGTLQPKQCKRRLKARLAAAVLDVSSFCALPRPRVGGGRWVGEKRRTIHAMHVEPSSTQPEADLGSMMSPLGLGRE